MQRWQVLPSDLEKRCANLLPAPGFARLCAEVYDAHADATGKNRTRLLGVKNPHFSLFADALVMLFPRARFVHVVRDYRDNVRSYQNVPFDLFSPAALAYRWVAYNTSVATAGARVPDRFHRVRFEDLVRDPGPTLLALCRFLGLDMDEAMVRPHEREYGPTVGWHNGLKQPVDAQRAARWLREMSGAQVALLDRICQPLGRAFGYEPAGDDTPPRRRAAGIVLGRTVTSLERFVFRLPVGPQTAIIRSYRRLTGNVIS